MQLSISAEIEGNINHDNRETKGRLLLVMNLLGMGYVILLQHSLSLPYNYFILSGTKGLRKI